MGEVNEELCKRLRITIDLTEVVGITGTFLAGPVYDSNREKVSRRKCFGPGKH